MKELLPNVKYFEFTGGEPWMIQEHFDLLKVAVEEGYSKNIDIHYNTNATVDTLGFEKSFLWNHFGRVDIAFSIDNVNDRFEYERYGAKWVDANVIIDGIHFAKLTDTPNITTQLCFTVNIQNVYYIDEILAWADTKRFGSIYFNMLHSPDHMSIQRMTPAAKELVLNKLKTYFFNNYLVKDDQIILADCIFSNQELFLAASDLSDHITNKVMAKRFDLELETLTEEISFINDSILYKS